MQANEIFDKIYYKNKLNKEDVETLLSIVNDVNKDKKMQIYTRAIANYKLFDIYYLFNLYNEIKSNSEVDKNNYLGIIIIHIDEKAKNMDEKTMDDLILFLENNVDDQEHKKTILERIKTEISKQSIPYMVKIYDLIYNKLEANNKEEIKYKKGYLHSIEIDIIEKDTNNINDIILKIDFINKNDKEEKYKLNDLTNILNRILKYGVSNYIRLYEYINSNNIVNKEKYLEKIVFYLSVKKEYTIDEIKSLISFIETYKQVSLRDTVIRETKNYNMNFIYEIYLIIKNAEIEEKSKNHILRQLELYIFEEKRDVTIDDLNTMIDFINNEPLSNSKLRQYYIRVIVLAYLNDIDIYDDFEQLIKKDIENDIKETILFYLDKYKKKKKPNNKSI